MISILILLVIVAFSLLVVHIGSVALIMTGVSREVAQFEALSAFTGTGFTTAESADVVSTRARRQVISLLMRLGSIGLATFIGTLALSFIGDEEGQATWGTRIVILIVGLGIIVFLSRSHRFDRLITPLIKRSLAKRSELALYDYNNLLNLREGAYRVVEITAVEGSWLTSAPLRDLNLHGEGIVILGIHRNAEYIGNPPASSCIVAGDEVVIYGASGRVNEIVDRAAGDRSAHKEGLAEHRDRDEAAKTKL